MSDRSGNNSQDESEYGTISEFETCKKLTEVDKELLIEFIINRGRKEVILRQVDKVIKEVRQTDLRRRMVRGSVAKYYTG